MMKLLYWGTIEDQLQELWALLGLVSEAGWGIIWSYGVNVHKFRLVAAILIKFEFHEY